MIKQIHLYFDYLAVQNDLVQNITDIYIRKNTHINLFDVALISRQVFACHRNKKIVKNFHLPAWWPVQFHCITSVSGRKGGMRGGVAEHLLH